MAWNNTRLSFAPSVILILAACVLVRILPDERLASYLSRPYSRALTDRYGTLVSVLPLENGLRREYLDIDGIPYWITEMFIASEDRTFFLHPGIDPGAVARAAALNAKSGRIESGASTITMQLARMVWPNGGGYRGKLNEAFRALELEIKLSKRDILELWLNNLPFGRNVEGIVSAAHAFFGKDLANLTPSEVLLLTIIPRRPGTYTPVQNNDALCRKALAIADQRGYGAGEIAGVIAAPAPEEPFSDRAPHFTGYIKQRLKDGRSPVLSSLDLDIQETADDILSAELMRSGDFRISNGAVFIIENDTGEIVCYLGSGDWFDTEHSGQIDGIRILRQPGSTLKPFLYAMSFESGFTPATLLADVPLVLGSNEVYAPENYDNRFRGPVLLRNALRSSLNVPAVRTVVRLGVQNFADKLIECGFESVAGQRDYLGSGIAVGNAEVSLFELVQGFSIFSRNGTFIPAVPFHEGSAGPSCKVFEETSAVMIRDILLRKYSSPYRISPGSGPGHTFEGIFKTGTSNQFNNIWALGSSRKYTAGVWMGNFSGETVMGKPGSSIPLSIASRILMMIDPDSEFPPPEDTEGLVSVKVCSLSGMRPTGHCPGIIDEIMPSGSLPGPCTVHGASGTRLPPDFAGYADLIQSGILNDGTGCYIASPADDSVYYFDPSLPAEVQSVSVIIEGQSTGCTAVYDGEPVYSGPSPAAFFLPVVPGEHTLIVADPKNSTKGVSRFKVIE